MYIASAQRIALYHPAQDAWCTLLNGGSLKFYAGTRPGIGAPFTLSGNTLLGTCPLANPAVGATNAGGVATFNSITPDSNPAATGDATFAFACKSDGTPIGNLSVGLAGSGPNGTDPDIVVPNAHIVATTGAIVISSANLTFPVGT